MPQHAPSAERLHEFNGGTHVGPYPVILIDPARVPGYGTTWAHLASDTSLEELHDFARQMDIPARGFDRDHYDVPADHHQRMIDAGAILVSSRELVTRLRAAGLRRPKPLETPRG